MGAGSSRSRVDAVLNMISEVSVESASVCLAVAENRILISVAEAENVRIENVNINSVADSSVQCTNNNNIQLGSLSEDLTENLQKTLQSAGGGDGDSKTKLVNDVVSAVNKQVVSMCITQAANEFEIMAQNVSGDVNITNLDINQLANAHMLECLNSNDIKVGDVPLREYLDEELPRFNLSTDTEAIACREVQNMQKGAYGAIGGGAGLVIIMVGAYLAVTKEKK